MIRKVFMMVIVVSLFVYISWDFYFRALSYNPLSAMKAKEFEPKDSGTALLSEFTPSWSKDIYEKNLFSPYRSYIEPKPVSSVPVEPPKRPELVLKGIVLDSFGDLVAYIEINKAKAAPMRKGDKIEDIEVIDISERKVMLKWNAENINLNIEKVRTIDKPRTAK